MCLDKPKDMISHVVRFFGRMEKVEYEVAIGEWKDIRCIYLDLGEIERVHDFLFQSVFGEDMEGMGDRHNICELVHREEMKNDQNDFSQGILPSFPDDCDAMKR